MKVLTTMQPDREIEVSSSQEYIDLQRMGLLLDSSRKAPELQGTNIPAPSSAQLPEGTRPPGEGA